MSFSYVQFDASSLSPMWVVQLSIALGLGALLAVSSSFFNFGYVRLKRDRDLWGVKIILEIITWCVLRDIFLLFCWDILLQGVHVSCSYLVVICTLTTAPITWSVFFFLIRRAIVTNKFGGRLIGHRFHPVLALIAFWLIHISIVAAALWWRNEMLIRVTASTGESFCMANHSFPGWILPCANMAIEITMHIVSFIIFINPLISSSESNESMEHSPDEISFENTTALFKMEFRHLMARNMGFLICGLLSASLTGAVALLILSPDSQFHIEAEHLSYLSLSGWMEVFGVFLAMYHAWDWEGDSSFQRRKSKSSQWRGSSISLQNK
jgi:hypothetical protein